MLSMRSISFSLYGNVRKIMKFLSLEFWDMVKILGRI